MLLTQTLSEEFYTIRTLTILAISIASMIICQVVKFSFYSIKTRSLKWRLLFSTGGFPSSHSSFCVTLCITLGMFQWHDLHFLHWSFAVAIVFSMIIIHDAMGVRLEASKHARILNNLASDMSDEEKKEMGYGKKGQLKEMLGHEWLEVLGGIFVGIVVGLIGFLIVV